MPDEGDGADVAPLAGPLARAATAAGADGGGAQGGAACAALGVCPVAPPGARDGFVSAVWDAVKGLRASPSGAQAAAEEPEKTVLRTASEPDSERDELGSEASDDAPKEGITLAFEDLQIPLRRGGGYSPLQRVSGLIRAGRLTALIGTEASGAQALMRCLSGYTPQFEGRVLANGSPIQASNYSQCVGYVAAKRIERGSLTVRQSLLFSLGMRRSALPSCASWGRAVRATGLDDEGWRLAGEVVDLARYGDCLLSRVPEEVRQRTIIAAELLHLPSVLFVENALDGLRGDLRAAMRLLLLLTRLAHGDIPGRPQLMTVVATLRNPRRPMFDLVDDTLLLHQGSVAYWGRTRGLRPYFIDLGYRIDLHDSASDFFLDHSARMSAEEDVQRTPPRTTRSAVRATQAYLSGRMSRGASDTSRQGTPPPGGSPRSRLSPRHSRQGTPSPPAREEPAPAGVLLGMPGVVDPSGADLVLAQPADFTSVWPTSAQRARLDEALVRYLTHAFANVAPGIPHARAPGALQRLWMLLRFRRIAMQNDLLGTFLRLLLVAVLGLLAGLIFSRSNEDKQLGLQNRVGMLFFILSGCMMGNLPSATNFVRDCPAVAHEIASGYYTPTVHFLYIFLYDVCLIKACLTIIFGTIAYFLMGFDPYADLGSRKPSFGNLVVFMLLTQSTFSMLALCVGSVATNAIAAQYVMIAIFVIFVAQGGFFINAASFPVPFMQTQYSSVLRYSYESALISELRNRSFGCQPHLYTGYNSLCYTGDGYLKLQGFDDYTREWWNCKILGAMFGFYFCLAYLTMLWRLGDRRRSDLIDTA